MWTPRHLCADSFKQSAGLMQRIRATQTHPYIRNQGRILASLPLAEASAVCLRRGSARPGCDGTQPGGGDQQRCAADCLTVILRSWTLQAWVSFCLCTAVCTWTWCWLCRCPRDPERQGADDPRPRVCANATAAEARLFALGAGAAPSQPLAARGACVAAAGTRFSSVGSMASWCHVCRLRSKIARLESSLLVLDSVHLGHVPILALYLGHAFCGTWARLTTKGPLPFTRGAVKQGGRELSGALPVDWTWRQLARCGAKPRLGHRWLRHRRELLLGDRHSPSGHVIALRCCVVVSMCLCCSNQSSRLFGAFPGSPIQHRTCGEATHSWHHRCQCSPLQGGTSSRDLRSRRPELFLAPCA